jgi:hypothetical protein
MEREADPVRCNLAFILNFLSSLFEKGLSYRYINVYRSAISAFHHQVEHGGSLVDVGKHPRVCDLLGGIANKRPPQPRYFQTWDICKVLDFFKSQGQNEVLSLKDLSLKLVMLLAITSFHRGAELHRLSAEKMNVFSDRVEFLLEGNLKTTKQGRTNKPSVFFQFSHDPRLCPKKGIEHYLERTLPLRESETKGFFLSFVKPHKPVGRDSIRRWIVTTISACGIDPVSRPIQPGARLLPKLSRRAFPYLTFLQKGIGQGNRLSKSSIANRSNPTEQRNCKEQYSPL